MKKIGEYVLNNFTSFVSAQIRNLLISLVSIIFLSGCFFNRGTIAVNFPNTGKIQKSITSVSISNNQIRITGQGLATVKSLSIKNSQFNENFIVESVSSNLIIGNATRAISIGVGQVFNLILNSAEGSVVFPVSFSLDDKSVTLQKLSSMGADAGDILKYNGSQWEAVSITSSQLYIGSWDALNNIPDPSIGTHRTGDYYIVSADGSQDLGSGVMNFVIGDWIIYNSVGDTWDKIPKASVGVDSFKGRIGVVLPSTNDYTWAQIDKSLSKIKDIADVDITGISAGKILKWDGTANWIIADDDVGASGIALSDLSANAPLSYNSSTGVFSLSNASITLPGAMTAADKVKLNSLVELPTGSGLLERFSSILSMRTCSPGEVLIWQTLTGWTCSVLDTSIITENGNTYFTNAKVLATPLSAFSATNATIVATDSILQGFNKAQGQISYLNTIKANVAGDTFTGDVNFNTKINLKNGGAANYVTIKASSSGTTSYELSLPTAAGTNGQVISTTGGGVLTWVNASAGDALTTNPLSQFAVTTSAQLAGVLSDETGSGSAVFSTSPVFINEIISPLIIGGTGVTSTLTYQATTGIGATGADHIFKVGNNGATEAMRILNNGNVGIGRVSPSTRLDVAGAIRISDDTAACTAANGGAIRYNSTLGFMEKCNGALWIGIDGSSAIPASTELAMQTCPASWTDLGTFRFGGVTFGRTCQSPSTLSLLPASSIVLMESCPTGWISQGMPSSGGRYLTRNNVAYVFCQSPASSQLLEVGGRMLATTCPAQWSDIAADFMYTTGATVPTCNGANCRLCEVPGRIILTSIEAPAAGPTYSGGQAAVTGGFGGGSALMAGGDGKATGTALGGTVSIKGGAGGATAGNGGSNSITGGLAKDGAGGSLNISGGVAATTTATPRNSGIIILRTMDGVANGSAGDITISAGNGNGTGANGNILLNSTILSLGNVGIGTANPSSKLSVSTALITGNIADFISTGAGGAGCSIAWDGTSCSSDIRLKENINPIQHGLDKVLKLQGVNYNWKKDTSKKKQVGFIAQDVEKIFPQVVKDGSTGYKQVNYANLISVVVEAVKEFYDRWSKDSISNRKEIALLKEENIAIKTYLCAKDPKAPLCKKIK